MSSIEYIKGPKSPTFLVVINDRHVYEMDERADQPNGVCIYSGDRTQDDDLDRVILFGIRWEGDIPRAIARQIVKIRENQMLKAARAAVEYVGSANYASRERAAMTYISAAARGDTSKTLDQIADEQDQ